MRQQEPARKGVVYFARGSENPLIKIGYSINPAGRLHQLRSDVGDGSLRFIGFMVGDKELEDTLHVRFLHLRVLRDYPAREGRRQGVITSREWFKPGEDLLHFIATLPRHESVLIEQNKVKASYLPSDLYDWLKRYADSKSTPYDKKSVAWAFRQAVYWFKRHVEGEDISNEDDD